MPETFEFPIRVSAPGRVNIIGEHTDYNSGFALPMALPHRVTVQIRARDDQKVHVTSAGHGTVTFPLTTKPGDVTGWGAYAAGVVWALAAENYPVSGADLVLTSDVPTGAGLSSSAAVECAVLIAFAELSGWQIDPTHAALISQRAENTYVGAPTGLMDQMAAMHGQAGHVMFIDFADNSLVQVPADFAGAKMELLVIDTRAPHQHVEGEYGARRQSCERAAEILGLTSLRDLTPPQLPTALATLRATQLEPEYESGDVLARRVQHVVTENARVLDAVQNLENGNIAALGPILNEGHRSLRVDYEVTVPQLDIAVEAALTGGALGARMTGGGFGGSVIALVYQSQAAAVERAVRAAFAENQFLAPQIFHAVPGRGASRD